MIIGIDPGASGAIAVIEPGGTFLFDMPVLTRKAGGMKADGAGLANIIRDSLIFPKKNTKSTDHWGDWGGTHFYQLATVYIEQVSAMPGQGVTSMFRFGEAFGIVVGVVAALGLPIHFVAPATWKKHHGLIGSDKDQARTRAIELYPHLASQMTRKKDIGRADALLIADWGLDNYG